MSLIENDENEIDRHGEPLVQKGDTHIHTHTLQTAGGVDGHGHGRENETA